MTITNGKLIPYRIKKFGAKNMQELQYPNGCKVMFSYQTPVVFFDGKDYYTCIEKYSRTTSKQITFYLNHETQNGPYIAFNTKKIPASELQEMIISRVSLMSTTF
jgi:hypothetical protein